jgi:hypothetical protein
MDWIMPEAEYEQRKLELPWPEPSDETIVTSGIWPAMNSESNAAESNAAESKSHVETAANEDPIHESQSADEAGVVVNKLDVLKRRKRGKKGRRS